jgi:cell wall-associated NlpC family hydrolase
MFSQRRLKIAAVCMVTTNSLVHSYRRSVGRTASIFRAKELRVGSGVHCSGLCTSVFKRGGVLLPDCTALHLQHSNLKWDNAGSVVNFQTR